MKYAPPPVYSIMKCAPPLHCEICPSSCTCREHCWTKQRKSKLRSPSSSLPAYKKGRQRWQVGTRNRRCEACFHPCQSSSPHVCTSFFRTMITRWPHPTGSSTPNPSSARSSSSGTMWTTATHRSSPSSVASPTH